MRLQLALIVALALALAGGSALAQGTFSPGHKPGSTFASPGSSAATKPGSYLPPLSSSPSSRPKTYGAPEAPKSTGFEPYKPFSGSSVYSPPTGAPRQDPCATSVYVNACGKTK